MIMVSAFSCGPASVIESYIAQAAEDNGIPFISLVVDEHTGEAGLLTRLEVFMDLSLKQAHAFGKLIASGPSAGPSAPGDLNPGRPAVEGVGEAVLAGLNSLHSGGWAGGSGGRVLGIVDMGTLRIPVTSMLRELGTRVVEPEPLSDGVVSLGRELAPEFICYPMVTLLGQIRSLIQKGVDRILMVQGKGRCRLGWYAQIMEQILHRAGYRVKILAVDSPLPWREKGERFLQVVREAIGSPRIGALVRAISLAVKKLAVLDRAEDILRETRAREEERGAGDRRYRQFLSGVQAATDMRSVEAVYTEFVRDMKKLWTHPGEPLRVALVGEIYVVNEPFANRDIEKVLGSLDTRVRVYRRLNVSNWVGAHLLKTPRALWERFEVIRAAGRYIPVSVGGHGQETVGETVLASRRGMDGVIHVFPFTCMPEIVAQNILVKVSNDLDIPVLSLAVSEQTGLAGLMTRLEAFCELLSGRRKKRL
ncbi:MAG: CoA protein activase [Candidatus Fermentithermobacillus carboniphilus]|uniref:CoA protein activase n=1 Tax=Candidatus Fermentithermobacillus carboniphilus TaxID=3085328 RepID=A0AAT9LC32_9FIRM|nr:MAG: CoA protein activase [Candidatus Fermentithermobacillus carboniphilus]